MFFPKGQVRVFLYGEPVNMRLSYDGLFALTKNRMGLEPWNGSLFAFINRRATQIKVLYFDRTGLCVWAKRLEQGKLIGDWGGGTHARDGLDRIEVAAGGHRAASHAQAISTRAAESATVGRGQSKKKS